VFCIYLRTNSDLCHLQHKLTGFYNRDEKCLQRGTDWVSKYSSLLFVFKGLIIASPCSGDHVQMTRVAQIVKKFTGVVESEKLLSCSKSPSFVPNLRQINPVHPNSISARSISILYSHLNVCIPIKSFQIFQVKFCTHFLYLPQTL